MTAAVVAASMGAKIVSVALAGSGQTGTDSMVITPTGVITFAGLDVGDKWGLNVAGSNYDVYVTKISGPALTVGTLLTWLNLATSRTFTPSGATTLQVQIRDAYTLTVLTTANFVWS